MSSISSSEFDIDTENSHGIFSMTTDSPNEHFITSVLAAGQLTRHTNSKLLIVTGRLCKTQIQILLDPGATGSFINNDLAKQTRLVTAEKTSYPVSFPDRHSVQTKRFPQVPLKIDDYKCRIDFFAAPILWDAIL